jgi:hypothetical protein
MPLAMSGFVVWRLGPSSLEEVKGFSSLRL